MTSREFAPARWPVATPATAQRRCNSLRSAGLRALRPAAAPLCDTARHTDSCCMLTRYIDENSHCKYFIFAWRSTSVPPAYRSQLRAHRHRAARPQGRTLAAAGPPRQIPRGRSAANPLQSTARRGRRRSQNLQPDRRWRHFATPPLARSVQAAPPRQPAAPGTDFRRRA